MKRKILSTILAILGISIVGIAILFFLGLFKEQEAGILVESDPISKVYIDGVEVGTTPYESNRKSGEVSIKIKPNQIDGNVLDDYETKINLVPGIKTIIKRSFKPSEEGTSGIIVSFEKIGGDDSYVTIVSVPNNAEIKIDNKSYGYTPLRIKIPAGDHDLIVSFDNYLEKSLPIRVYKGFKLTAAVKLAKITEIDVISEPVPVIDTIQAKKISVNKNDVGFLRVRSGANTGFPEVGQVKPDEVYDVLEEGENGKWYKIKIGETEDLPAVEGWVSSEFVTKIPS